MDYKNICENSEEKKSLIECLKTGGATQINFTDDSLIFKFEDKKIIIHAAWCNTGNAELDISFN